MKKLITKINEASSLINKRSKSVGNFIIISEQLAEEIYNLDKIKLRREKLEKIKRKINENKFNNRW